MDAARRSLMSRAFHFSCLIRHHTFYPPSRRRHTQRHAALLSPAAAFFACEQILSIFIALPSPFSLFVYFSFSALMPECLSFIAHHRGAMPSPAAPALPLLLSPFHHHAIVVFLLLLSPSSKPLPLLFAVFRLPFRLFQQCSFRLLMLLPLRCLFFFSFTIKRFLFLLSFFPFSLFSLPVHTAMPRLFHFHAASFPLKASFRQFQTIPDDMR